MVKINCYTVILRCTTFEDIPFFAAYAYASENDDQLLIYLYFTRSFTVCFQVSSAVGTLPEDRHHPTLPGNR